MEALLPHIKAHFDSLQDRLVCFAEQEVQVEGWFKGEMLYLLSQLRKAGTIQNFDREVRLPGAQYDLKIELSGILHWIELKHWLVGVQKGDTYNPQSYFTDPCSEGLTKDFDKLSRRATADSKWFLILATHNPGEDDWQEGLARFHRKFSPRRCVDRSQPAQFPQSYFLGLLNVAGDNADSRCDSALPTLSEGKN